jgi:hypothetical protein
MFLIGRSDASTNAHKPCPLQETVHVMTYNTYESFTCCITVILFALSFARGQTGTLYDIVLTGGRVIDPETKLDAIKNVGILQNRISQISSSPLQGKQMN